jgi:photosystem II stability/assembly factor-like uncharacterized protein
MPNMIPPPAAARRFINADKGVTSQKRPRRGGLAVCYVQLVRLLAALALAVLTACVPARRFTALTHAAGIRDPRAAETVALADVPVATHLGEWRNLGPFTYAGKVYDLAVDPWNADVVYAAFGSWGDGSTNAAGAGLWRTLDGGRSWSPIDARNPGVLCVRIHPTIPGLIAAGLRASGYNRDRGVLLSRDAGATWTAISLPEASLNVFDIGFHLSDPNTLWAATHTGLYKTTDGGQTWTQSLAYSGSSFWNDAPSLAMHPTDSDTLLLAVQSRGVVRSADGGNTWTRVDQSMDQREPMTALAWSASDPSIVYAERVSPQRDSAGNHVAMFTYQSTDAGQTWTQMTTVGAFHQTRYDMALAVHPADAAHVIVANTSMAVSVNGLRSTVPVAPAPHSDHLRVVFAPSDPRIVYNGNDGGVWKSVDGGYTWARADFGASTTHVFSFAVSPESGNIYLSAADYGGIVYYPEHGWRNLDCGFEYQQFYVHPAAPSDAYVGGKIQRVGGIDAPCKTIDPAPAENRPYHVAMAFDPADGGTIYAGLEHVWRSRDRGATWQKLGINETLAKNHNYVTSLQVAPTDARRLYAVTNLNFQLWTSRDGGDTWSVAGAYPNPTTLAVSPQDPNVVWVGTSFGLYLSVDGGANGAYLFAFPAVAVNRIVVDASRAYVATNNGVLFTEDNGATWARLGDLPTGIVVDLSLVNGALYAATDQGIWSMDLTGATGCAQRVSVTPARLTVGANGGTQRITVSAAPSCAWTATVADDWARLSNVLELTVAPNSGDPRQTTLAIGGVSIPIVQAAGQDPIVDGAVVTVGLPFRLRHSRDLLFNLVSVGSGNCLDSTQSRQAGVAQYEHECNGEDHQLFQFVPRPGGGWSIVGATSLLCLESRGARIEQQVCSMSEAQRWLF